MDTSSGSSSNSSTSTTSTVPVPPSDNEYDPFGGSSPLTSIESRSTDFEPTSASGEEASPGPIPLPGVVVPSSIVMDAQEQEAARLVGSHLVRNVPSIINAALPRNPDKRETAARLSAIIAELLEELLNIPEAEAEAAIRRALDAIRELVPQETRDANANLSPLNAISGCFAEFEAWLDGTWTQLGGRQVSDIKLEARLYRLFPKFVMFIAHCINAYFYYNGTIRALTNERQCRIVVPFGKTDTKPTDSDNRGRVDIGLKLVKPKMPFVRPQTITNAAMFAIAEAKAYAIDHVLAFNQLFRYSRPLYERQPDRRFLWGLTVCGEDTYVCLFMPSKAYATSAMNVQTPEGCRALINFFVGWSLCEWDRCGYDPSMVLRSIVPRLRRNPIPMAGPSTSETASGSQQPVRHMQDKLTYYEIQVHNYDPESQEHTTRQYFANLPMVNADRLFSRHTRCFSGSFTDPSLRCGYDGRVIATSLLKTGWPESNMDIAADTRDECHMLRKITRILGSDADLNGRYPTLVCGGRARIDSGDGVMVDDSVQSILAEVDTEVTVHRVHKRLVIEPLGEPLNTVRSVRELIMVLYDVMSAYSAISGRCQILHRDISTNNIIVCRNANGSAHGTLIDFDFALDIEWERESPTRYARTGTLPFMSVNNLEQNENVRTQLDDWESLLSLVCYLGTFGINNEPEHKHTVDTNAHIYGWREGNKVVFSTLPMVDPFRARVGAADIISADLLTVLREYADEASNPV
ncbi:hypothetical protein IWW41_000506 [Coemansia sp. RSA 2522]|nr:hypothetical protein IWW41_000506 [Coemansia sp. RSA 2522]